MKKECKITHPKKLAFLQNYPKFGISKLTAKAIGIGESTVRAWNRDDKVFFNAFNALKKEIEAELIELHERNIDEVAFGEKTPAQSRIFGSLVRLRAIAPDKYRGKVSDTRLIGDITVKLNIPRPGFKELPEAKKQLKEGKDALQIKGTDRKGDEEVSGEAERDNRDGDNG